MPTQVPQRSVSGSNPQGVRFDSWKEIAAYLGRDLKTVQRWERELGLPVHRLFISRQARVYAYQAELDAWAERRSAVESPLPASTSADTAPAVAAEASAPPTSRYLLWAGLAALIGVAAYLGISRVGTTEEPVTTELTATPFASTTGAEDHPAISPDGKQIAFAAAHPGGAGDDIFVQLVGSYVPLRLTDSLDQDHGPAWSPDGSDIVFLRRFGEINKVIRIPALGGSETVLAESRYRGGGLSWSPDNKAIAMVDRDDSGTAAVFVLSLQDLSKRQVTSPTGPSEDCCPKFDPAGERIAYLRSQASRSAIHIASLDGRELQVIETDARGFAWTQDGESLVFSSPSSEGGGALHRVRLSDGRTERLGVGGSDTMWPDIAGGRLAYTRLVLTSNIWSIAAKNDRVTDPNSATRLTSSSRREYAPDFSPDGQWIVFGSDRTGSRELWVSDKKGGQLRTLTEFGGPSVGSPRWSPDGDWITFDSSHEGSVDIYVIPAAGGLPRRLTVDPAADMIPTWSHDGKWLYFVSDRSGERQIWKVPSEGGDAVQLTRNGGFESRASADGRYLYYAANEKEEIRRLTLSTGEDEAIPELSGIGRLRRGWTASKDGIYFVREKSEADAVSHIEYFAFAEGKIAKVAAIEGPVFKASAGLAVSPDGATLLYVRTEHDERDIMLVENFR